MTTADDVIAQAERWLGAHEQPPGSNHVPGITDWFGIDGAWCDMLCSRVLTDAGIPHHCAWVPAEAENARNGVDGFEWIEDYTAGQPGDLILFDWQGGVAYDHIGIVVENTGTGYRTIEGNVSDSCTRQFRAYVVVAGFARPPYAAAPQPEPPQPIPQPEDDDMTVAQAVYTIISSYAVFGNGDKPGQRDAIEKVLKAKDAAGRDHAVEETLVALAGL